MTVLCLLAAGVSGTALIWLTLISLLLTRCLPHSSFVARCHHYNLPTSLPPLPLDKSLICIQLKTQKGRQRRFSCPHTNRQQHPSGRGSNLEAACAKNKQQQNFTMSPRIRNGAAAGWDSRPKEGEASQAPPRSQNNMNYNWGLERRA